MATYNLSNNMADRINYDDMCRRYFDEQIRYYVADCGELDSIDRSVFDNWFRIDEDEVDDTEEAEARAWSMFQERLAAAKIKAL